MPPPAKRATVTRRWLRYVSYCCAAAVTLALVAILSCVARNVPFSYLLYVPGSDGTYAQNYQDVWAMHVAVSNGWGRYGFYLDLGAFDGERCSNTALLERELGWAGLCVEAWPEDRFRTRRCSVVARALHWEDGLNATVLGDAMDKKVELVVQGGASGSGSAPQRLVKTIAVKTLLREYNVPDFVHFVSLDMPGYEVGVLQQWPYHTHKMGFLIVAVRDIWSYMQVRTELVPRGYEEVTVANRGVDRYFVHRDYMASGFEEKAWRVHPVGSMGC